MTFYMNTNKSNFQNQFPRCTAQLDELTACDIKPMKLFIDWEKKATVPHNARPRAINF